MEKLTSEMTTITPSGCNPLPIVPPMTKAKLFVLMGIPGCGKSTWAMNMGLGTIYSSDSIREEISGSAANQDVNAAVFPLFHHRIKSSLYSGHNVVADSTALTPESRKEFRDLATLTDAEVHLVVFTNLVGAFRRNRSRERVVPEHAMLRMISRYETAINDILFEGYKSITYIQETL